MALYDDPARYEFKYKIEMTFIPQIRDFIRPYATIDDHIKDNTHNKYTVRSIYFDTPELDSYYEKMDGIKIRKKLRVRTYDDANDYAFLEIKRKYVNCIMKERSRLPFSTIERLINAPEHSVYEFPVQDYNARLVSGKFLYNLLKKGLIPTLLVVYEREAYQEKIISQNRLTVDSQIRALSRPDLSDIQVNDNFVQVTTDQAILELKFDATMPKWMKSLCAQFRLKKQSYSKYCMGLEACREVCQNREMS